MRMNIINKIKSLYLCFEDIFMTNHFCIGCGREIPDGTEFSICEKCLKSMEKLDGRVCTKCGEKLVGESLVCDYCKNIDYSFNSNRSCFYYDDIASRIVKGLKYGGKKYYANYIAQIMAMKTEVLCGIDFITCVPISTKGLRSRGFNQSELIAREIAKLSGKEFIQTLLKDNTAKHQAGLSREDRLDNLKGSFHLIEEVKSKIRSKNILVIDDVFTTGATLIECSKEILRAKPKSIKTFTFAKTRLNSSN